MAYTETLFIYKDTYLLCKLLLQYSKNVSRIIRYGAYEIAISKACTALDVIRRINESFEHREENLHEYILLMSEASRESTSSPTRSSCQSRLRQTLIIKLTRY